MARTLVQRHSLIVMIAAGVVALSSGVRAEEAPAEPSNTEAPAASSAPAAPASPAASAAPAAPADDKKPAKEAPKEEAVSAASAALLGPPSGLQLTFSWSNNIGLQAESALRYFQTSLQVSANYKLHPKVFFAAAISPFYNVPISDKGISSDNRIWNTSAGGNFVRLNFRNLYKESITGIAVGASATYQLPLTFEDLLAFSHPGQGNPRAGALGAALQLFRSFGDLTLIGNLSTTKPLFFFRSAVEICEPTATKSCSPYTNTGSNNVNFALGAGLTLIYALDKLVFVGGLSVNNSHTYGPDQGTTPTLTAAALPGNQRFSSSFFFQGGYSVNDQITANVGYYNAGPQIDDASGYNNPFFNKQYAGVYFGFDYVQ